jgi:predicted RNA-binding protein with PIN domain
VYTREGETADNFIERKTSELSKKGRVRVVTSDYIEQVIIFGHGATRVSANEFQSEVAETRKHGKQYFKKDVKNTLMSLLDSETAKQLEMMRLKKD